MDVAFFDYEIEYRFLRYRVGLKEGTILCSLNQDLPLNIFFIMRPLRNSF